MTQTSRAVLPLVIDAVKALAHPSRLRILAMLRGGDLCVCQVTAVLEVAPSTVSSHLSDLRRAGFVTERKSGKWVHYRLVADGPLAELARQALRLADADEQFGSDARAVGAVRRIPIDTLCGTGLDRLAAGAAAITAPKRLRTRSSHTRRHA